jgi:hypothetical protein
MPATPGKRVTRSRAAATKTADEMNAPPKRAAVSKLATSRRAKSDVEDMANPEDTIASAAAKRRSQTTAKAASTVATARRRIKVTPLDRPAAEDTLALDAATDEQSTQKPKSSGRKRKEPKVDDAMSSDHHQLDEVSGVTKLKTRRKAAADKGEVDEMQPAAKPRGRPKKAAAHESIEEYQQQQPVRQTRTRAGSGAAATQATAASTAKVTAAARKKVTFQDLPESDKENLPLVRKKLGSKESGAAVAGGLRAKPVRKPATSKGRKTAGTTIADTAEEPRPTPLSPKKVTQVAKSSSPGSSDEDELSGAKTPIRDLSKSPKRSAILSGTLSPVKKLDFGAALLSKSSDEEVPAMTLMSPARKLPPTPFKDGLKESPKRGDGVLIFPPSALKANAETDMSAQSSQSQSVLRQSPKRGAIGSSIFTQSAIKSLRSPAKPTLMQSPPKRLFLSSKSSASESMHARGNDLPLATSQTDLNAELGDMVASSRFRASQSPQRFAKVHRISSEELALGTHPGIDFDESVLDIRSPIKASKPSLSSLQSTGEEAESLPVFSTEMSPTRVAPRFLSTSSLQTKFDVNVAAAGELMEGVVASLAAENVEAGSEFVETGIPKDMAPALFSSVRLQYEDELSEDELQVESTSLPDFRTDTPGLSSKRTPSRVSTVNPVETSRNVGFTPLAAQLSSWLTTSPNTPASKNSQQHGLFSPLAAVHVPGKVQVSRQSTPQRSSIGSRSSMAAAGSANRRSTKSARKLYDLNMAGSPERTSYFADEMAIKDLEEEVEGVQMTPREEDAKPPEALGEAELLAIVEEKSFEVLPHPEATNLDDGALREIGSDEREVHDHERPSTTPTRPEFPPTDADAEAEAKAKEGSPLSATVTEEPMLTADGKPSENPEGMKQARLEVKDCGREVATRPTSPTEDYGTPNYQSTLLPRFVNTVVSKVPLRPEGYISPIKIPKKRSRSLSAGPSSTRKPIFAPLLIPQNGIAVSLSPEQRAKSPAPETPGEQSFMVEDFGDSTLDGIEIDEDDENLPPSTPSAAIRSTLTTPGRSPLKAVQRGVLQGAVVFVDVHTTEGADASGIFIELLTQMGARCVKQWNWNPRASTWGGEAETGSVTPGEVAGKVGITHVVFKDGGKRTLEKVRDAGGVVRCVGVGWVLE